MRGLLAVLLLVIVSSAGAASLGRLAVLSAIGEPLRAEIEVSVSPEELETATARFAPAEAYAPAGLQYNPALNGARITIQYRHHGRRVIDMVTTRRINEPAIQLLVELEVRGTRILRAYNVILDAQGAAARGAPAAEFAPVVLRSGAVAAAPRATAVPLAAKPRPASAAQAAAGGNPETEREIRRLEAQLNDQGKTLAGMLERVAVMERQVQQLQRMLETQPATVPKPTAVPATTDPQPASIAPPLVSAVAATAPAVAEPPKPAATVMPPKQVREALPASVPPLVRPRSWTDTLFDNALLVMAGILLVMVVGLVYWTWGRRPAGDAAKAPPPEA